MLVHALLLVADPGFEPGLTDSESALLPVTTIGNGMSILPLLVIQGRVELPSDIHLENGR